MAKLTRSQVIQATVQAWQQEQAGKVSPDPEYAHDGRSQYPEGVEVLSAPADAIAECNRRVDAALKSAGYAPVLS